VTVADQLVTAKFFFAANKVGEKYYLVPSPETPV
jgi:hypothetical protein